MYESVLIGCDCYMGDTRRHWVSFFFVKRAEEEQVTSLLRSSSNWQAAVLLVGIS
jgi:hypothetical protein